MSKLGNIIRKSRKKLSSTLVDEIAKWLDGDPDAEEDDLKGLKSEVEAFHDWCGKDDALAEAIVNNITHSEWTQYFGSKKLSEINPPLKADNVREAIEVAKVAAKNKQLQKQKPLKDYDESAYESPGKLMAKWDLDLERIQAVHAPTAQEMVLQDKSYERAVWEIANNEWTEDNKTGKAARQDRKQKAEQEMAKLVKQYEELERQKQQEDAKAGKLDDIVKEVDEALPETFRDNALCMELWNLAKTWAGKSGAYHLKTGYEAKELKAAWTAWGSFQEINVKGFQTWRIGNGKAQDKSDRSDIKDRPHSSQMNFAVVWRGTMQMIHVGLKGTETR
ncbi:MAG TPA: hypothetical protein VFE51_02290 [Verrucomicrobiae bacterium]|nr:hypothetical protein [Verrucomicrobiae bacterium]